MLCVKFKQACGPTHRENYKMLNIAKRMARALKGQKEALEAQWEILMEMQDSMKQIAWYQKSMAVTTLQIAWELE